MYKIYVRNNETGAEWWEYGTSKYMMKRIDFLMNDTNDYTFERICDIIWCLKLSFSFKTFVKCLKGESHLVKKPRDL